MVVQSVFPCLSSLSIFILENCLSNFQSFSHHFCTIKHVNNFVSKKGLIFQNFLILHISSKFMQHKVSSLDSSLLSYPVQNLSSYFLDLCILISRVFALALTINFDIFVFLFLHKYCCIWMFATSGYIQFKWCIFLVFLHVLEELCFNILIWPYNCFENAPI